MELRWVENSINEKTLQFYSGVLDSEGNRVWIDVPTVSESFNNKTNEA